MPYLQVGLALAFILWFAFFPLRGRARIAHLAMTVAMILLVILYFQWLWPSAYAPAVFMFLLLLTVFLGRRRPTNHRETSIWPGILMSFVALVAAIGAGFLIKSRLRPASTFDLAPPFAISVVVTEGGTHRLINRHLLVMDADTPSLSSWHGVAHGISVQPLDGFGRPLTAVQTVTAPCAGAVVADGQDARLGRYLTIDCGGTWVVLSGLAEVTASGTIAAGDAVGSAVNLTLHAQLPGIAAHPFSGDPVWITVNGAFPVRGAILGP